MSLRAIATQASSVLVVALALHQSVAFAGFVDGVQAEQRKDYVSARREYLVAAQDGNAKAQNNLGRLYRQGLGGPVDLGQALYWFTQAASLGQVNAQTSLADMFEKGDGVTVDYLKAAYWYQRAANAGFFIAQLSLGELFENGRGVPQDPVRALAWYRIAARAHVNPANQYFVDEGKRATAAAEALGARLSDARRRIADDLADRWMPGSNLADIAPANVAAEDDSAGRAVRERLAQERLANREAAEKEHEQKVVACKAYMFTKPNPGVGMYGAAAASAGNAALCDLDPEAPFKLPPPANPVPVPVVVVGHE